MKGQLETEFNDQPLIEEILNFNLSFPATSKQVFPQNFITRFNYMKFDASSGQSLVLLLVKLFNKFFHIKYIRWYKAALY